MDLKEFIQQALVQVAEGLTSAQAPIQNLGGMLNPSLSGNHEDLGKHGLLLAFHSTVSVVTFDIALTANTGQGTKGGIGVIVGAVSLGSTGESKTESSTVSRIKFAVPMMLPPPQKA